MIFFISRADLFIYSSSVEMASITAPTMQLAKGQLCFTASGKVSQPSIGNFSTEVKGASWTSLKSSCYISSARSLSYNLTHTPVKSERLVTKAMSEASNLKPLPGLPVDLRGYTSNLIFYLNSYEHLGFAIYLFTFFGFPSKP